MTHHEAEILDEQVAHHQRVIAEVEDPGLSVAELAQLPRGSKALTLRDVQMALVAQIRCKVCGKPRVVLNLAGWRRPMQLERVTPETHCACPPRVDADGSRHVGGPAWELVSVECEHCDHGEIVEMFDGYPERSLCGMCEGLGRVPTSNGAVAQERAS
jgi:hypothetical protein